MNSAPPYGAKDDSQVTYIAHLIQQTLATYRAELRNGRERLVIVRQR
jgi:hypothetical protein